MTTDPSYVRITRSKSSMLIQDDAVDKSIAIENLRQEICKLTSVDNFFQDTSIVNDTTDEPSVDTSNINVEDETLRKRRSGSKDNNVAHQQQQPLIIENVDGYKYSGYLKYKKRNIFSIIAVTILVVFMFILIDNNKNIELIRYFDSFF
jgi:hypothetical protein